MIVNSSIFLNRRGLASTAAFALTVVGARSSQASPNTYYNVNLNGYILGNPFSSSINMDNQGGLANYNLNLTTGLLRADAGYISANWGDLGFASSNFQGLALGVPMGKIETSLIGGNVVVYDPLGRQTTSPVYGLRASTPLSSKFSLNAAQLFIPRGSGSGKSLSSAGLNYQFHKTAFLRTELARSGGGFGGMVSAQNVSKRLALAASYRRVSSDFSSGANPNLITERNGLFAVARYQIKRPLTFELQHRNYTDGFGGHAKSDSAFLSYAPANRPSVTVFHRTQDTQSRQLDLLGGLNFAGKSTGVQLSHSFGSTYLTGGYDRFQFDNSFTASDSGATGFSRATTNRVNASVVHLLNRKTRLSLQHIMTFGSRDEGGGSPRSSYTAAEVTRTIGSRGLSFTLGFDLQSSGFAGEAGKSLAARIGASIPTGRSGSFGILVRSNVAASGTRSFTAPDAVYLTFSRKIQIGKMPSSARLNALGFSAQERRQLGKITGRVFEDRNENGRWDVNEPGISDVKMSVPSVQEATGENGQFALSDLPAGSHQVAMVVKTLPIDLALRGPSEATINVSPGKSSTVDFPVVRTGQIRGLVFNDANRDGKRDADEAGIANAIVRVEDSDVVSFTDKNGQFALYNLPPRTWKVSVDTESMTQDLREFEPTGSPTVTVDVKPNADVSGLQLGVVEKERDVVIESLSLASIVPPASPASPTPNDATASTQGGAPSVAPTPDATAAVEPIQAAPVPVTSSLDEQFSMGHGGFKRLGAVLPMSPTINLRRSRCSRLSKVVLRCP